MANNFETEEQFKIWLNLENGINVKEDWSLWKTVIFQDKS
jgi:hypothetical protein